MLQFMLGCSSPNIHSPTKREYQWEASHFCGSPGMDNSRGELENILCSKHIYLPPLVCVLFIPLLCTYCFQVITLCERLAGQDANVTTVPVSVLRLTRQVTRLFEWTNDVADRLAFSEVNLCIFPFKKKLSHCMNSKCKG